MSKSQSESESSSSSEDSQDSDSSRSSENSEKKDSNNAANNRLDKKPDNSSSSDSSGSNSESSSSSSDSESDTDGKKESSKSPREKANKRKFVKRKSSESNEAQNQDKKLKVSEDKDSINDKEKFESNVSITNESESVIEKHVVAEDPEHKKTVEESSVSNEFQNVEIEKPPEKPNEEAEEVEKIEENVTDNLVQQSENDSLGNEKEVENCETENRTDIEIVTKEEQKTEEKIDESKNKNVDSPSRRRRDRSKDKEKHRSLKSQNNSKEVRQRSDRKYDRRYSNDRSPHNRNRSRSRRRSRSRSRRRNRSRSRSHKKSKREKSKTPPKNDKPDEIKNLSSNKEKDEPTMTARQRRAVDLLTSKTGGAYIPPVKLRLLQAEITDKSSAAYQRIAWEALKKSIHGYINKVNVDNIGIITRELLKENIIRGRGLLCRSIIQAQAASPTFTHVYAALVAIINSKFPNIGELLLKRLVIQFKRGFRRNDKTICLSASRFIAHLVNQRVAHEILALEILTLLIENPTDDSVEVAIAFLRECGMKLTEVSSKGISAIYDMLKNILHEGTLDKRVQYMIEVVFQVRKDGFKDHQSVIESLELVEEDDQFTHLITLDEATETQDVLNVFKFDDKYQENETKYTGLSKELLGSDAEDSGSGAESGDESGDAEGSDDEDDENKKAEAIIDSTETNLVALRRTIYLTIHSSLDYEECAHKLMKMELKPGQEAELCHMFLDCCAEQRTYEKFYGLLAQRFCSINKIYIEPFEEIFKATYSTTHRLDTNRLRNVSKFFAHLLFTDAIGWDVMDCIHLNEEETTSSSRIFIKILFQELAEYMGLSKLNSRLKDPAFAEPFSGLFPRDNPKNSRFAINFFTSIGLGGLTDDLRQFLKSAPKPVPVVSQVTENNESIAVDSSNSSSSSSSSSSSDSSSSSQSESDSDSDDKKSKRKHKKNQKKSKHDGKSSKKTKKLEKTKKRNKNKKKSSSSSSESSSSSSDSDTSNTSSENRKRNKKSKRNNSKYAMEEKKIEKRTNRNPFRENQETTENEVIPSHKTKGRRSESRENKYPHENKKKKDKKERKDRDDSRNTNEYKKRRIEEYETGEQNDKSVQKSRDRNEEKDYRKTFNENGKQTYDYDKAERSRDRESRQELKYKERSEHSRKPNESDHSKVERNRRHKDDDSVDKEDSSRKRRYKYDDISDSNHDQKRIDEKSEYDKERHSYNGKDRARDRSKNRTSDRDYERSKRRRSRSRKRSRERVR